jgi:hypothetical protein
MQRLPPINDYEKSVLVNVERCGWHCTSVFPAAGHEETPRFSYTVGLYQSYGQPEFIIFGLSSEISYGILGILASAAAANEMYPLETPCNALVNGYACVFVKVPETRYNDYVFSALWYNAGSEFPLYQVVWPDANGAYPWNPQTTSEFKLSQPVLGTANLVTPNKSLERTGGK